LPKFKKKTRQSSETLSKKGKKSLASRKGHLAGEKVALDKKERGFHKFRLSEAAGGDRLSAGGKFLEKKK